MTTATEVTPDLTWRPGEGDSLADMVGRAILHPVTAARYLFGIEPWRGKYAGQYQILEWAYDAIMGIGPARITIAACTGSGKTAAGGVLYWWVPLRFQDAGVVCTSASWAHLELQLGKEARRCRSAAEGILDLPELVRGINVRIPSAGDPMGDRRACVGANPRKEEGLGGYHWGVTAMMIDEASQQPDYIHDAAEGAMSAGAGALLEWGNPLNSTGGFYRHHTTERAVHRCMRISAFDTPNLEWLADDLELGDVDRREREAAMLERLLQTDDDELRKRVVVPNLTRALWVKERHGVWGPGTPKWEARVMGDFPQYGTGAVFPLGDIEAAEQRAPIPTTDDFLVAGVDVAGGGRDETSVTIRDTAGNIVAHEQFGSADARGDVLGVLNRYGPLRIRTVFVDKGGLGHTWQWDLAVPGYNVAGINFGGGANDPERFAYKKDEIYWAFRERLGEGSVAGLKDETTTAQLATVVYGFDVRGRTKIQSKADAGTSPDRAESVILAFLSGGSDDLLSEEWHKTWSLSKPLVGKEF